MDSRGGQIIKTGKIGRVNCLRQQIIMPGESLNISLRGKVMLESLRERDTLRINAHLGVFMTPIRWLDENFTTYLKEGPETSTSIAMTNTNDLAALGVGSYSGTPFNIPTFWRNAYLRVYNEWYKWPEDADATTINRDGEIAVPLQHTWNRCRYDATPDNVEDYEVAAGTEFDVRELAEIQARFRSAMERDVLSYNRYMELIKEMYNADGSREVDQVPMMVDQIEIGVNPREIPATDSAGLGQWQSLFDFGIDHQLKNVTCPEHAIITYMLTIRFAPIIEGRHPMASDRLSWAELVGDPEILKSMPPQEVQIRDVAGNPSSTVLGYLPAGWQWRSGSDVLGRRIDVADSFPFMLDPTSQANAKDATRIRDAFRSTALGDYVVDVYCQENSRNMLGSSLESYFSGMTGSGSDAEFPKQGKML